MDQRLNQGVIFLPCSLAPIANTETNESEEAGAQNGMANRNEQLDIISTVVGVLKELVR